MVANTIIEGNPAGGRGPVITFSGTQDETCVLSGFTIRNGSAEEGGGISGGASNSHTHGTIQNNVITDNDGGGIGHCDGIIRNNVITGNSGHGLSTCNGTIQNNVITGNAGSGIAASHGTIENNTIVGNPGSGEIGGWGVGGLCECHGTIRNCIIWGNKTWCGSHLYESVHPTYSCIQDRTEGAEGNIAFNPRFVDAENGDFHLSSCSPCIDAGDPSSDFSNEPHPNGGRVNMGAYGNTPEAASKSPDSDHDGLPDDWEIQFFGDLRQEPGDDPDRDLSSNIEEYRLGRDPTHGPPPAWHVDASVSESRDGRSPQTAFKTIREGINAASEADIVLVAQGIYVENIHLKAREIILCSTDYLDPDVVANTIIDGNQAGSVVRLRGTESQDCILCGFTIRAGRAEDGAGIHGNWTKATIRNNVITGNSADANGGGIHSCDGILENNVIAGNTANYGGGLYGCHGAIENNTISDNSARYGGGLARCDGAIQGNTISANFAEMYGGGLARCHGDILKNIITWNSADMYGGGLYGCDGTIERNRITGNFAGYRAGGLDNCLATIQNNIISGNWAMWNGGGLYSCDGTIVNNTIVANSAGYCGGGLDYCCGTVQNCIIWANRASQGDQLYDSSVPAFSCIQDWTGGGQGNIADDPIFTDPDGADNNYRLQSVSPCIDAGINQGWMSESVDLDGKPRILDGDQDGEAIVDMGACEYRFVLSVTELIKPSGAGLGLKWNSRPEHTYTIYWRTDLLTGEWIEGDTVGSGGQSTTWTDSDGSSPCKFYRIELKR